MIHFFNVTFPMAAEEAKWWPGPRHQTMLVQVRQMGAGELRSRNVFDTVQNFVRSLYVFATGNYNRKK